MDGKSENTSTSTTLSPLKVALFGAGRHAQHHAKAIANTPGAILVAVADPSVPAQEAMRTIAPHIRSYKDPQSLLAEENPDVVHVVTPPATHAELATRALQAGCHVYVEKPFTESVTDAELISEEARRRNLLVCAGHQLLFERPTRLLVEYLPAIGKLVHIESYFSFRTVRHAPGGRRVLRADHQLLDILPHPVYLLLRVFEAAGSGTVELVSLELSREGTVHALIKHGDVTASLVVSLEARPIESYLRVVGRNGSLYADYVRGTMHRSIGPGSSGVDKLLAPYRLSRQLISGTTAAMARRFFGRGRSYPGLGELFAEFYSAIRNRTAPPLSPDSLVDTVRICERVALAFAAEEQKAILESTSSSVRGNGVLLTGGTGFLGKEIVRALLQNGGSVRVVSRREPSPWERLAGVEYAVADIADAPDPTLFDGITTVIHAAAETAGGWPEHQRNSIDATGHMIRAAAGKGVKRFIQVSSLAVLASSDGNPIPDNHPLEPNSRGSGPYVWGKLESERLAADLGRELDIDVKIVRPGALVDYSNFEPPGRLGKRLGNFFVAVGSAGDELGIVDATFAGRVLAWSVDNWDALPESLNLLDPQLPTKRVLLARLRQSNPDLTVIWLPRFVLIPLSWIASIAQRLLRPGKPPINIAKVFSVQPYSTAGVSIIARSIQSEAFHPAYAPEDR